MKGKKSISFILVVLSSWVLCYPQGENPEGDENRKKFSSLHKSLIIPGWGQIAEGCPFEGLLLLSSEALVIYQIFKNNHRGNGYYDLYKAATNTEDASKYRELTEKYDRTRNQMMVIAAGVWALNLVHIVALLKYREKEKSKLGITLDVSKNQTVSICIHYSY